MIDLRIIAIGGVLALGIAIGPNGLSESAWLMIAAIAVEFWRGSAFQRWWNWPLLGLGALCVAFGEGVVIALFMMAVGVVVAWVMPRAQVGAAGPMIVVIGFSIVVDRALAPLFGSAWLSIEASLIGWIAGLPVSGAAIGDPSHRTLLLWGCAGLPMAWVASQSVFAAGRLLGVPTCRSMRVALSGALLLYVFNVMRIVAMTLSPRAYEMLHTEAFNQISGASVLFGAALLFIRTRGARCVPS